MSVDIEKMVQISKKEDSEGSLCEIKVLKVNGIGILLKLLFKLFIAFSNFFHKLFSCSGLIEFVKRVEDKWGQKK